MNFLKTSLTTVKKATADIETKLNAFESKPATTDAATHSTAIPTHTNVIASTKTESVTNAMANALPNDASSTTATTTATPSTTTTANDAADQVETTKGGLLNKMEGAFSSMGLNNDESTTTTTTPTADADATTTTTTTPAAEEGFMGTTINKVSTINHEVEEKATGLLNLMEGKKDNLASSTETTPAATSTENTSSGLGHMVGGLFDKKPSTTTTEPAPAKSEGSSLLGKLRKF